MSAHLPAMLQYDVVDVFTDRPFAGNPLAVVHGAESLADEQLHAIATEFNLSETTFPSVPADGGAAGGDAYDVRIFTPGGEIPFAGHPTLGTA
jgi:trans-2,3-dihydro-3-hydroxyanthranilate isomerase